MKSNDLHQNPGDENREENSTFPIKSEKPTDPGLENSGKSQSAPEENADKSAGSEDQAPSVDKSAHAGGESLPELQSANADSKNEPGDDKTDESAEHQKDQEEKVSPDASADEVEATEKAKSSDDMEEDEKISDSEKEEEDFNSFDREKLISILEEYVQNEEINAVKTKVALVKVAFLRKTNMIKAKALDEFLAEGGKEEDYKGEPDELQEKFDEIFSIYRKKRQDYLNNLEQLKKKNLEDKKLILEELKALIDSEETLKRTYDEFRALQDRWKQTGVVPRGEVNNLWQNYHFYVEKFFDKVKINKELRDLDLKKNLELKIRLCERAEELLLETSITKSFKELQKLHDEWKEVGPVPQDKRDELWERFKTATDKINQRRRDHYSKIAEQQKDNLTLKTDLCEKAEELLNRERSNLKDWQKQSSEMSELLNTWKKIGPAPRKYNDEIWERFKGSLDAFFSDKKEFLGKIKEEQINNYNRKLELCIEAEGMKDSSDWKKTTADLIHLQNEWKKIGPVPRKHSDKIWKRFRAACDEFFNRKTDYFKNIDKHKEDNLRQKQELIITVRDFQFGNDKEENLEALKNFQREWTRIGHVPMKDKDKVQNEFREVIDRHLDKLKISGAEMKAISYRSRLENIREQPNARKIINNEMSFLLNKKRKMEEEIKLWENNLGFLAESKKANLLKKEFEKKIDNARKEVEVIDAKMRFLEEGAGQ